MQIVLEAGGEPPGSDQRHSTADRQDGRRHGRAPDTVGEIPRRHGPAHESDAQDREYQKVHQESHGARRKNSPHSGTRRAAINPPRTEYINESDTTAGKTNLASAAATASTIPGQSRSGLRAL